MEIISDRYIGPVVLQYLEHLRDMLETVVKRGQHGFLVTNHSRLM